jgi:hypothetical protein
VPLYCTNISAGAANAFDRPLRQAPPWMKMKIGASFASGAVYVQSLDVGRAIGDTFGLADTMARQFTVADSALDQCSRFGA